MDSWSEQDIALWNELEAAERGFQLVARPPMPTFDQLATYAQPARERFTRDDTIEFGRLELDDRLGPSWRDLTASPDFLRWAKATCDETRRALASDDPNEVEGLIKAFKKHRGIK